MNNLEIIEKITKGTTATEQITLSNGETVTIRPLNSGELSELQALEKKGYTLKMGMEKGKRSEDLDVNAGDFQRTQAETLYKAVALSMSVNGIKVKTSNVKTLPPGIPEEIFVETVRISQLKPGDLQLIKNFRPKT